MKKIHKNLIISASILLFVAASGTAYYKFVYKKAMKEKTPATDTPKDGKTNDKEVQKSGASNKSPAKV